MSAPPTHAKRKRAPNPNTLIYANPLPLLLSPVRFPFPHKSILNPHCSATYDPRSRSVWVTNARDVRILWERGFFGKGTLSRSEPSWKARKVAELNGAEVLTAEELTSRRRAQRKQFKADRARAIAQATADAEAAFAAARASPDSTPFEVPLVNAPHNVARPELVIPPTPGKGKAKDGEEDSEEEVERQLEEKILVDEDTVEDMEHLQLTLPEAFFLSWALSCLRILDPSTSTYLSPRDLWSTFLRSHLPSAPDTAVRRPDNPFLIHYVAYHHFRSLGWVVRGGIKFCVDYLLYKRGPVFQHAEFAIVLCPEYEDPADAAGCPWPEVRSEPFTWAWFSTLNRVNSQVKKTLILAYVTIPAMSRVGAKELESPKCLREYSVREVVVRRFVPARMRD